MTEKEILSELSEILDMPIENVKEKEEWCIDFQVGRVWLGMWLLTVIVGVVATSFLPWFSQFGIFVSFYSFFYPVFSFFLREKKISREDNTVRDIVRKVAKSLQMVSLVGFIGGGLLIGFSMFLWARMYPTLLELHLFKHYPLWLIFLCCALIGVGLMILPARTFSHLYLTQLLPFYISIGNTQPSSLRASLISLIPIVPLFLFAQPLSTAFLVLLGLLKGFDTSVFSNRGLLYPRAAPISIPFTLCSIATGLLFFSLYIVLHPYQNVTKLLSYEVERKKDL